MTWDFGFAVCVPVWFRVQVLRKISRAQRCKVSGHMMNSFPIPILCEAFGGYVLKS